MNSVLPLSDIVSPLARKERFERCLRLGRTQALAEDPGFLIDVKLQFLGFAAHQCARGRNRAGRKCRDLTRRVERLGIDVLRIDHQVGNAVILGASCIKWMSP